MVNFYLVLKYHNVVLHMIYHYFLDNMRQNLNNLIVVHDEIFYYKHVLFSLFFLLFSPCSMHIYIPAILIMNF